MSGTDGGRYYVEELNPEDVVDTAGSYKKRLLRVRARIGTWWECVIYPVAA